VTAAVVVFAISWTLIAFRRLRWLPIGRPAGAVAGGVGMVAVGALTPREAWEAVDGPTITLLLGMMLYTAYVERARLFEAVAARLLAARPAPGALLAALSVTSAGLSAVLVNDTVCLFLTPLVLGITRRMRLPPGPYLVALATAANLGSAATLVGNPQNMLVGSRSGLSFTTWLGGVAPAAAAGLAVHLAWMAVACRGRLVPTGPPEPDVDRAGLAPEAPLVAAVGVGILLGFLAGFDLGVTTLAGVVVLFLAERREPREAIGKVDGSLLLFFAGLFVVVAGFARTGLPDRAWEALAPHLDLRSAGGIAVATAALAVGSNVVSNVPLVLLVGDALATRGDPTFSWMLLGFVTTVAGNLTLVGSVANIIVAEQAKGEYELGFFEYLRVGFPSTVLVLSVGVPVLWWTAG
jgi:Na+/H+ antiporter NhaD/arsenite permease-like protein